MTVTISIVSVILNSIFSIGRENSGEEIIVKSSFQLNLPPHLIIPSSSIQLSEVIGQGTLMFVMIISLLLCMHDNDVSHKI